MHEASYEIIDIRIGVDQTLVALYVQCRTDELWLVWRFAGLETIDTDYQRVEESFLNAACVASRKLSSTRFSHG